jgi:hypothetical protein
MTAAKTRKGVGSAGASTPGDQQRTDTIFVGWSGVWIGSVVAVVIAQSWRLWDGFDYLIFGAVLALPCFGLPLVVDW